MADDPKNGVQDLLKALPDVLRQEPQHEVAVLLQQLVLPAVTAIRLGVSQVLASIELHSNAGIRAQQVDLQAPLLVERNHHGLVEHEPPLGLGERFQSPEQELLRGAAGACRTFGIRWNRVRRGERRERSCGLRG